MRRAPAGLRPPTLVLAGLLWAALLAPGALRAATLQVLNSNDSGSGSLRAAILAANQGPGADSIFFSQFSVFALRTIHLQSPLPAIAGPTVIDATTAQWWNGRPMLRIDGEGLAQNDVGLDVLGSNVTVRGFQIVRMSGPGVRVQGANFTLTGSFVGTGGTDDLGNGGDGVACLDQAGPVTIGGTAANQGNLISGNGLDGISLHEGCLGGTILGNRIGSDELGEVPIANGAAGVTIHGGNVQLGGLVAAATNLISGNEGPGVAVHGAAENVVVAGNRIGPRSTGPAVPHLVCIGNAGPGVLVTGTGTTVGGTVAGAGNLILCSGSDAIRLDPGSSGALIAGNRTGFVFAEASTMGNSGLGLRILGDDHQIGGRSPDAANIIVANYLGGIWIAPEAAGNRIEGNWIGTTPDGIEAWGHFQPGVRIDGALDNTIGGEAPGAGNVIAWNIGGGVLVTSGAGNRILGNVIHHCDEPIALGEFGAELNDHLDSDGGPNLGQNFPYLTAAPLVDAGTHVTGSLESTPSSAFRIEIFAAAACGPTGFGEAESFVAADWVATDAAGHATIDLVLPPLAAGWILSAAATDQGGNTSSISPCLEVGDPWPGKLYLQPSASLAYEGMGEKPITIVRSGGFAGTVGGTFRTEDFEATAPSDYSAIEETFTMTGADLFATIEIPITFDLEHEAGERFNVAIEELVGEVELNWEAGGYVHIVDNYTNAAYYQVMGDVAIVEGQAGQKLAMFTVRVTGATGPVVVDFSTHAGTATGGVDYSETAGVLTFQAGGATQTVAVPILGDVDPEGSESFRLQLIGQGNTVCWRCSAWATILDDDPTGAAGGLRFAVAAEIVTSAAGEVALTVERVGGSTGAVSVRFETVDGTALAGSDYLPVSGQLAWAAGDVEPQTIYVAIIDTPGYERSRRFAARLFDPEGGAALVAPALEIVEVVRSLSTLFMDGFESGDVSAWSSSQGDW